MKFDVTEAIKAIHHYGSEKNSGNELHVAYGVDRHFLFGAGISIASVIMNNKDTELVFHLFTDYEDDVFFHGLKALAQEQSVSINVYLIDKDFFKSLPNTHAWSVAIYYRFIAFEYLSSSQARLLYLDADVMCKGSLEALHHMVLPEGTYAAVVKDVAETRQGAGDRLGQPQLDNDYFNSGVMFVSLVEWKKNNFLEQALALLLSKEIKLHFFDQDVLNILFVNHTLFLSEDYNCIYGIKKELKFRDSGAYKNIIKDSTILIHYIGVTKPWNSWANYPSAQYFKRAWQFSPWAGLPLLGPRTPKQYKKKSRHERLQGLYGASVVSYLGYLWAKLKQK